MDKKLLFIIIIVYSFASFNGCIDNNVSNNVNDNKNLNDDLSIIEAYYLATKEAHPSSVIGAVICDTYEQLNDHLHGHGTVYPDESPNDNYYWYWRRHTRRPL